LVQEIRSSKFERVFNYSLIGFLILLGLLVISGIFKTDPRFRNIFGGVILAYGFLRLWLLSVRYRREGEEKKK
jgi:hypothetical protein